MDRPSLQVMKRNRALSVILFNRDGNSHGCGADTKISAIPKWISFSDLPARRRLRSRAMNFLFP